MRHNINAMASVPIRWPPPSLNRLNFPGSTGSISFHLFSVFVMDAGTSNPSQKAQAAAHSARAQAAMAHCASPRRP